MSDISSTGFGPQVPDASDIARIGITLEFGRHLMQHYRDMGTAALMLSLAGTGQGADSAAEQIAEHIVSPIGEGYALGGEIAARAANHVVEQMRPLVATSLMLGMPLEAMPSMRPATARARSPRRARRKKPDPQEPPSDDNMLVDPQGPTPADPPVDISGIESQPYSSVQGGTTAPISQPGAGGVTRVVSPTGEDTGACIAADGVTPIACDTGQRIGGQLGTAGEQPVQSVGGGLVPIQPPAPVKPAQPIAKPRAPLIPPGKGLLPVLPEPIPEYPPVAYLPPLEPGAPIYTGAAGAPMQPIRKPVSAPLPGGKIPWPPITVPQSPPPSVPTFPPPVFTFPQPPGLGVTVPIAPPSPVGAVPPLVPPIQPAPAQPPITPIPPPQWPLLPPLPAPGEPPTQPPTSPPPPPPFVPPISQFPFLPGTPPLPGAPTPAPEQPPERSPERPPEQPPTQGTPTPGGTVAGSAPVVTPGAPIYITTPAPVVNVSVQPPNCCGTAEIPVLEPVAPSPGPVGTAGAPIVERTGAPGFSEFTLEQFQRDMTAPRQPQQNRQPCPPLPPSANISPECLPGWDVIGPLLQDTVYGYLCRHGMLGERGQLLPIDKWATAIHEQSWWGHEMVASVIATIGEIIPDLARSLEGIADLAAKMSGCTDAHVALPLVIRWLVGIVERWIGTAPPQIYKALDRWINWFCPSDIPGQEEANAAWIGGTMSDERWECLTRANDNRVEYAKQVRDAQMEHLSFEQAVNMRRRGIISDDALLRYAERNGIHSATDYADMLRNTEWVASPSDAINWMLKDITDPNIVDRFDLSAEFDLKYKGVVKEVFDANGMSEQSAKAMWLAHWRNMSPTTLYEMHKRLRPGRFDALPDEQAIGYSRSIASDAQRKGIVDATTARDFLRTLTTTAGDLYEALGQADYPPYWRARLMAVSYNVLTRVDIRRAYETGQMGSDELLSQLQDRGYTEPDSRRLFGFFRAAAIQLASRRPAANQWVSQGYDTGLLKQALIDTGMREDMWSDVYAILENRRKIYVQSKCIESLHKGFKSRLLPDLEVHAELDKIGISGPQQMDLITSWRCERDSSRRELAAALQCKLFKQEIIDRKTLQERLKDLRYTPRQVRDLVGSCETQRAPRTWGKIGRKPLANGRSNMQDAAYEQVQEAEASREQPQGE